MIGGPDGSRHRTSGVVRECIHGGIAQLSADPILPALTIGSIKLASLFLTFPTRAHRPHAGSFDHRVGAGEDRLRDCQAEGLRRLEIDDQLERGRLLNRQIGGLGAVEDLARINPFRRYIAGKFSP